MANWLSRLGVLGALAIGLSACVSSEVPLIGQEEQVFPFESVLLEAKGGGWVIIERLGDGYVQTYGTVGAQRSHGVVAYRFTAIDDQHFLLQASGLLDDNRYLYAVARLDRRTGKVVIVTDGTQFVGAGGLRKCDGDSSDFCVVDIDAFAQSASTFASQRPPGEFDYQILRARDASGENWRPEKQASPAFVEAFRLASSNLTPRQVDVVDGLARETTLESLVAVGTIQTPYDCLPEHRILCHETLAQQTDGKTVIVEWGEWRDSLDEIQTATFVSELINEAAALGFNLLTSQELARAAINVRPE